MRVSFAAAGVLALLGCAPAAGPRDGGADVSHTDSSRAEAGALPWCGADGRPTVAYPPGPHEVIDDAVLPDLSFADGRGGTVRLSEYFDPCGRGPRWLVLRELAAWSGPSQWHAGHTARAVRTLGALGEGVRVLDLLALGRDNLPATEGELSAWTARFAPAGAGHRAVLDPAYSLSPVFIGVRLLPAILAVDTRTMRAARVLTGPDLHLLDEALAQTLARAEGRPVPPHTEHAEHELSEDQWDMLRAMALVPPPPSPSNRYADDGRAAALGERLFSDTGLSAGGVSCASCHDVRRDFTDGRATGMGVGMALGGRNTPTVRYGAYTRWVLWDGRADSLWSQALGPIENPIEMGSSRLRAVRALYEQYRAPYEAIFGPLPDLSDTARFAADGRPGEPGYDRLSPADRAAVDGAFANLGKSIEAYERTLRFAPSAVDRFIAGDASALTPTQQVGMHHYFASGCAQCHHGPMMTDDSFHNLAMPTGQRDGAADRGRADGIARVLADPFNAGGAFSDAPMERGHLEALRSQPAEVQLGRMHTPGLRGVSRTGPWGHGGTFSRMEDVMRHYSSDMVRAMVRPTVGETDPHLGSFHMDAQTISELTSFVNAL
jgi:cytochrome c peroxidase